MMLECSTGELLASALFMDYDDEEHFAALKGLRAA